MGWRTGRRSPPQNGSPSVPRRHREAGAPLDGKHRRGRREDRDGNGPHRAPGQRLGAHPPGRNGPPRDRRRGERAAGGHGLLPAHRRVPRALLRRRQVSRGYRKKEGRITDREILSCRLVDRTVRPLFPDGYYNEVQIQANVLAFDGDGDPEVLAIIGGAAALHFSDIPFRGPVVGLRVVKTKDGAIRALPNAKERESALLDMVISIGPDGLVMLEGLANEVPESDVVAAIDKASAAAKPLFTLLNEARSALGCEARPFDPPAPDATLVETVHAVAAAPLEEAYRIAAKQARQEAVDTISRDVQARFAESHPDQTSDVGTILHDLEKKILRSMALGEQRRVDGRGPTEIRPIFVEAGVLPSVHGSALFTRGETQALVVATLGTAKDEQDVETLGGSERERFQLHYSFPPYSVGEIRPLRGPGRREIGHGNLAFRGLAAVIPTASQFPYTIKVESEVTESNGSSSMATVCGGCLALMDAGIPVRRPVAGIAMGLISEGDRAVVLSDILGAEDHLGDMDFKVAGTKASPRSARQQARLAPGRTVGAGVGAGAGRPTPHLEGDEHRARRAAPGALPDGPAHSGHEDRNASDPIPDRPRRQDDP
ncbi:MAG: polyribonucleotide nucleotidyltransferase [Candidatus Eisenbacteria bacterium]